MASTMCSAQQQAASRGLSTDLLLVRQAGQTRPHRSQGAACQRPQKRLSARSAQLALIGAPESNEQVTTGRSRSLPGTAFHNAPALLCYRSLADEAVVDDGADSFWFDNLYTYWWQEESDRPVLRRDADDCTDNRWASLCKASRAPSPRRG